MNDLFDGAKKLSRWQYREIAAFCGGVALLLLVAAFVAGGGTAAIGQSVAQNSISPTSQTASIFPCSWFGNCGGAAATNVYDFYASPTSVMLGQSTTLYWTASRGGAPLCEGPGASGRTASWHCYINGTEVYNGTVSGAYTVTPSAGSNVYTFCSQVIQILGGSCLTATVTAVAPTPTTLTSLTASPATITAGSASTLTWQGSRGTNFSSCELADDYGHAWWYSALPGSDSSGVLATGTHNFYMQCYDTTGASTGWRSATVTVTAPPPPPSCSNGLDINSYPSCTCPSTQIQSGSSCVNPSDVCTDIPGNQPSLPSGCTGPVPPPVGSCIPSGYQWSGSSCTPIPLCSNGLNNSYAPSCTCPAHQYQPLGSSVCVALPICANGLSESYSPSCTCPAGQVQSGSSCVLQGVIQSFTANPSRVLKGNTANISWSTSHMSSCSLTSLVSTGSSNLSSVLSGSLTPVINSKTVFTLTCTDASGASYSASATVNLIPQTIEQ